MVPISKKTHSFLSKSDFDEIYDLVAHDYLKNTVLWVYCSDNDIPLGFMGISGNEIDSLFISPHSMRKGIGSKFIDHAQNIIKNNEIIVSVNEQNDQALVFYRSMGFQVFKRTERDAQDRPYPLLYMKLINKNYES